MRTCNRIFSLILLSTSYLSGQFFSFGAKGGVPLSQAFHAETDLNRPPLGYALHDNYQSATQRTVPYTIGPAAEFRLFGHLRFEADGLYSRADYDYTSIVTASPSRGVYLSDAKHTVSRWEFPMLVKYRAGEGRVLRPFVAVGASIQYSRDRVAQSLIGMAGPAGAPFRSQQNPDDFPVQTYTVAGPVIGAGAELGGRRPRFSSELRYTRWVNRAIDGLPALHSSQNSLQFLAGFDF